MNALVLISSPKNSLQMSCHSIVAGQAAKLVLNVIYVLFDRVHCSISRNHVPGKEHDTSNAHSESYGIYSHSIYTTMKALVTWCIAIFIWIYLLPILDHRVRHVHTLLSRGHSRLNDRLRDHDISLQG